MSHILKNLLLNFIFNGLLFVFLMIGIQNSSSKNKVNLIFFKTIYLPTSFIVGTGFISGSIIGNILFHNYPSGRNKIKEISSYPQ